MFIVFVLLSHVISWVRCGTWLCRDLIFAIFYFLSVNPIYGRIRKIGVVVVVLVQICEICLRRRAQRRTISAIIQVGLLKVGRRFFVISFYFWTMFYGYSAWKCPFCCVLVRKFFFIFFIYSCRFVDTKKVFLVKTIFQLLNYNILLTEF